MQADIYLVFTQDGQLLKTRVITHIECVYRSIDRAEEFAKLSTTLIDLGSIETFSVHTKLPIIKAMRRYDRYQHHRSIKVATIYI